METMLTDTPKEVRMSRVVPLPTDEPLLLRHDRDGVATLTLNRPRQYNALSEALLAQLQTELDSIASDAAVRVVVIAGSGPAFCAGHDLKEMRANYEQRRIETLFAQCTRMMLALTQLPQPVIARVHGLATAAGCQLVAQCDLAVAAATARFATSGINVGLFCSTPAVALSRNVSRKLAMEMLLTGDFIDAQTAMQQGLVNHVVAADDLDGAVHALTEAIRKRPRESIAMGKKLFYAQADRSLPDAYTLASQTMACNFMLPEAAEGVDAFMDKRSPRWPK
jgi:enoyl-CoA hydratase/carnithine racemase